MQTKSHKIIVSLVLFLCLNSIFASTATIIYFNDGHVIYPLEDHLGTRGGVARLKTVIDDVKKENPNTFTVFGGDLAGGLLFGAVYKGFPMVEAYNQIPIDLANFGQHDFDFGVDHTLELIKLSKFPWITSNLKNEYDKPFADLDECYIKELGDIKVGFVAITDSMDTTTPSKRVVQKDIIESVKTTVNKLKQKSVDYIIVLTQTSHAVDSKLLEEIPEIDAIFSEENYEAQTNIIYYKNKPILSPCGNQGSIIRLDLNKINDKIQPSVIVYSIDENVEQDKELHALEEKYRTKLEEDLSENLAVLTVDLNAGFDGDSRSRFMETNVGNLIADSYKEHFNSDIAFMQGGGIRANATKGNFTLKEALAIIPFANTISLYECSGKTILGALEYSVSKVERKAGCFLQVSGVSYSYNPKAEIGSRIGKVTINGEPIDLAKNYTVAMSTFLKKGGDGFTMFKDCKELIPESDEKVDIDIFSDYCRKLKSIGPQIEGRIEITK